MVIGRSESSRTVMLEPGDPSPTAGGLPIGVVHTITADIGLRISRCEITTCRRLTTAATGEAFEAAAAAPVVRCSRAIDVNVTAWPRHTGAPESFYWKVVGTPRRLETLQENEGLVSCLFECVLTIARGKLVESSRHAGS